MPKALVLFSGGLDSTLAARVMQDRPGLEVEGIHFASICTSSHSSESRELAAFRAARDWNLSLRIEENSEALLKFVKNPKHKGWVDRESLHAMHGRSGDGDGGRLLEARPATDEEIGPLWISAARCRKRCANVAG